MKSTDINIPLALILALILTILMGCNKTIEEVRNTKVNQPITKDEKVEESEDISQLDFISSDGTTIMERFNPPEGYERISYEKESFGYFLQRLPLKAFGEKVYHFDGREKTREVHISVIDMDTGDRDLQQCADAIMRLRGEYLYHSEQYEKIHFNFTNGFTAAYIKWLEGYRISVDNNEVNWYLGTTYDDSYETFRKYMDIVFAYAGTLSLSKELIEVESLEQMKAGDIFIKGGSPGHAVIVVDVVINPETNNRLFLLAQSYMPAQDMHILINPTDEHLSPWYSIEFDTLVTPEWTFDKTHYMRFQD
ncbi:MAG: hypothetical protein CVV02_05770 [Firmicutes bacterium HGW-Firmicutes-7]|nr:MAG: hypothetical protein CVV02_05770 [Firmicutes bacterium HGW-Firmicutes-7]